MNERKPTMSEALANLRKVVIDAFGNTNAETDVNEPRERGEDRQIAALRLENARLRELLDELTENFIWSDDFGSTCIHCSSSLTSHGVKHTADCPWLLARQLLDGDK